MLDKIQIQLAVPKLMKKAISNLNRYTIVSNAANEARTLINEPGGVANPGISPSGPQGCRGRLDIKVWDEKRLQKEGYNGLIQVGKGSASPPRMIRSPITPRKQNTTSLCRKGDVRYRRHLLKPADKMWR